MSCGSQVLGCPVAGCALAKMQPEGSLCGALLGLAEEPSLGL